MSNKIHITEQMVLNQDQTACFVQSDLDQHYPLNMSNVTLALKESIK